MTDPNDLIVAELDSNILSLAVKNSNRSTIKSFKTGAVIFDKHLNVQSVGTSHFPYGFTVGEKRSVHAEDDALDKISWIKDKTDLSILIYTLNWSGTNHATSSRPCVGCAERLLRADLRHVFYLERDNAGSWLLNREKPARIVKRSR